MENKYRGFKVGDNVRLMSYHLAKIVRAIDDEIKSRKMYLKPDTPVSIIGFEDRPDKSKTGSQKLVVCRKNGVEFMADPEELYKP